MHHTWFARISYVMYIYNAPARCESKHSTIRGCSTLTCRNDYLWTNLIPVASTHTQLYVMRYVLRAPRVWQFSIIRPACSRRHAGCRLCWCAPLELVAPRMQIARSAAALRWMRDAGRVQLACAEYMWMWCVSRADVKRCFWIGSNTDSSKRRANGSIPVAHLIQQCAVYLHKWLFDMTRAFRRRYIPQMCVNLCENVYVRLRV